MSGYLERDDELQEDGKPKTNAKNNKQPAGKPKNNLEKQGPVKDKDYKVLHKDGSLAANLPDKEAEGSGALDGTVGLGT